MGSNGTGQNCLGLIEVLSGKLRRAVNSRMVDAPAPDVYEIRPRKDEEGFDLISGRLRQPPNLVCGTRRGSQCRRIREVLLLVALAPGYYPRVGRLRGCNRGALIQGAISKAVGRHTVGHASYYSSVHGDYCGDYRIRVFQRWRVLLRSHQMFAPVNLRSR